MGELFRLEMNDEMVRFTPDGRILVTDAIGLLGGFEDPETVWRAITTEHPEIMKQCEQRNLDGEEDLFVADTAVWDKILPLLAEHLLNPEAC